MVPSAPIRALRSSAWDRSVALEQAGDVAGARDALELAWTAEPESYEVALRTGWLSLRLDEVERAVARYERARSLPGAGPDAERGLAAAHTRAGYQDLAAGARAEARAHFDAALALDPEAPDATAGRALAPSERIAPELWASFVGWSLGRSRAYGGGVFVALPLELADDARLRAAYRHLELSATEPGSGAGAGRGAAGRLRLTQDEAYLGAGYSGA
ncbi:MAG: hypothetical protein IT373_15135, partial [Polyangiaceae bacterium]|nr:hypothetical protein [Polyangiaceae bacterium]